MKWSNASRRVDSPVRRGAPWARAVLAWACAVMMIVPHERAARALAAPPARDLWLWYGANLADDAAVAKLEGVWKRAAAAGYTHVMLYDSKFEKLESVDDRYFANVARVKALAATLGLEIVPGLFTVGRANVLLARDPNGAEALPVVDAPFVVENGIARALTDPAATLPPRPEFSDPEVQIEDAHASVRDNAQHARFRFHVTVAPMRCYHISVMIRTADFSGEPLIQVLADGRAIHFIKSLGVRPTQDWTRHDVVFNSLDHTALDLWFGAWKAAHGTLEWKDWRIEEPGPVNVVRRAGAPFHIAGLTEGRDFDFVADPLLGRAPNPGDFDGWHDPPALRVRVKDGTRLRVSWQQLARVYNGQVAACVSDSGVMARLADQARRVREAWSARGYLMMHDEIRALGTDSACASRHLTPGQILAENARACAAMLSGADVYVWNDMFDPYHNAVKDYFLVHGDLAGSWEGLAPSVVIVNWNDGRRDESLRFFAQRGHRQIIAGYYDGRASEVTDWLSSAREVPNVTGVMYTTWRDRYDDLEAFANAVRAFR